MSLLAKWFLAFVLACSCDQIILWLLARRLQRMFPAVWKDLGRPKGHVFQGLGYTEKEKQKIAFPEIELSHFVWRHTHAGLRDRWISLFVWILRFGCVLTAVAFLTVYRFSRISD
jgi:hypothetical protein